MRQVLGKCKASKADDPVACFEVFATQQMPKKMAHSEKMHKKKWRIIIKILIFFRL